MAPVFPPGANQLVRWSIVGGPVLALIVAGLASALYYSPVVTNVNIAKDQPIPFSHQRHVSGNGLDCRYCHTTVETSNFAGIPPTETCMTCHSQILTDQPMFAPILESWQTGKSMEWTRLNDLPDFVYFDHSIHINRGIGCNHCHSNDAIGIEEMRLTVKAQSFRMSWCMDCHKDPAQYIRPRDEVFNMAWEPGSADAKSTLEALKFASQRELGEHLIEEYNVEVEQMTNCSICHR
ncbi:MAG: cytochrome c3 family protein [Candidatus Hydrogenedentota bacterium]